MVDAQIGHEKTMTTLLPACAVSNVIYGMGMLEMGMTMSYEQLLIDAEIILMTKRVLAGITVDEVRMAADLIRKTGPGGSFLGEKHTRDFMRSLSMPRLLDRRMVDAWMRDGGKDLLARAHEEVLRIRREHQVAPLPEPVRKELDRILEEAREEMGATAQV